MVNYWYGRAHWGKGYATEVARAVIQHAFESLGVKILRAYFVLFTSQQTTAGSRRVRVLDKLGFVPNTDIEPLEGRQDGELSYLPAPEGWRVEHEGGRCTLSSSIAPESSVAVHVFVCCDDCGLLAGEEGTSQVRQ